MPVFGKEPPSKSQGVVVEIIRRVNDNIRRLRVIEQKIKTLDMHVNSMEQDMITMQKSFQKALNERDAKTAGMEDRLQKLDTLAKEITKQMKMIATKASVEELKNMMEIYNPMNSNFVTRNEAEKMLKGKSGK